MFNRLQKKWKVSGWRFVLIMITFAVGGSLTGWLGKMLMALIGIKNAWIFVPVYIIVVTIIWPMMVLIVSLPLGQFPFFLSYIKKMGSRISGRKVSSMQKKQIAIFASGAGSNAQAIIDHFRNSSAINISLIVCNKPRAGVIAIAEKENIPLLLINKEKFFRGDAYVRDLKDKKIDMLVLAGFLWKIPDGLIQAWPRRIINIHPALLPQYGGKGMYGGAVHEAVLSAGAKESGITIHYVDEHYDNGDIILQVRCPILENDTPETLAHRVHALEHANYPVVISELLNATGKL